MKQLNMFDILNEKYKIKKPIKLIELFAGIGSQAKAIKRLGIPFQHHKICEWAIPSIIGYDAIHTFDNKNYLKDMSEKELNKYLFQKGISRDYNEPMKLDQVERLSFEKKKQIYNSIIRTNNLVNITTSKGEYDIYNYQPKVSKSERNAGCDEFEEKNNMRVNAPRLNEEQKTTPIFKNNHPTLKPIALNEKVLRLFKTPNEQKICYAFAGSGSEIIGGIRAGFDNWVGCEINQEYVDIAKARITYWTNAKINNEKNDKKEIKEKNKNKLEQLTFNF